VRVGVAVGGTAVWVAVGVGVPVGDGVFVAVSDGGSGVNVAAGVAERAWARGEGAAVGEPIEVAQAVVTITSSANKITAHLSIEQRHFIA
jgi:hypothetical protein